MVPEPATAGKIVDFEGWGPVGATPTLCKIVVRTYNVMEID
eukprot:COSAG02_NODE_16321_length_1093_cov_1.022133_2_plen_40_part_01